MKRLGFISVLTALFILIGLVGVVSAQNTWINPYVHYVNYPQSEWEKYIFTDASYEMYKNTEYGWYADTGQKLPDGATGRHGNEIAAGNQAGQITIAMYFHTRCYYCQQLIKSFVANKDAYSDVRFIFVDVQPAETGTDIQNFFNTEGVNFPNQVAYYNTQLGGTAALRVMQFLTKYKELREPGWNGAQTYNNTPMVLVFKGNGTSVDLRAITNGPYSYQENRQLLLNVKNALLNEDPANPLDDENVKATPTPTATNTVSIPTATNTAALPTATNTVAVPTGTSTAALPTVTNTIAVPTGTSTAVLTTATNTVAVPTATGTAALPSVTPMNTNTVRPLNTNTPVPPRPTETATQGPSQIEEEIIGQGDYYALVNVDALYNDAYQLLNSINQERKNQNPAAADLVMDKDLMAAAMQRASELSFYYRINEDGVCSGSDCSPRSNGSRGITAISGTSKYQGVPQVRLEEIISEEKISNTETLNAWLAASGQEKGALLDGTGAAEDRQQGYRSIGIGIVTDSNGQRHVAVFFADQPAETTGIHDNSNENQTRKIAVTQDVLDTMTVRSGLVDNTIEISNTPGSGTPVNYTVSYDRYGGISTQSFMSSAPFIPTYVQSSNPGIVTAVIQNGQVVLTGGAPGTAAIEVGLAGFNAGAPDRVLNTLQVTVRGAAAPTRTAPYFTALLYDCFGEQGRFPGTGFSTSKGVTVKAKPKGLVFDSSNLELMLPGLDVREEIVRLPKVDESYPVEWLDNKLGLLEGSHLPGEGVSIIVAHNHLNQIEAGPFLLLRNLKSGDHLFVRNSDDSLKTFEVYENVKLPENAIEEAASYLYEDSLMLITCEDESMNGGYLNRRIVYARPLS